MKKREVDTCVWRKAYYGSFTVSCSNFFSGAQPTNLWKFCCYCGKKLVVKK